MTKTIKFGKAFRHVMLSLFVGLITLMAVIIHWLSAIDDLAQYRIQICQAHERMVVQYRLGVPG